VLLAIGVLIGGVKRALRRPTAKPVPER